MASLPSTMRATIIDDNQQLKQTEIDVPTPGKGKALVNVSYVAQNPTDVQSLDNHLFHPGGVLGCDFVGKVVSVGENSTRLKEGDRVAALIWGGEVKGQGGYSEYCVADDKVSFKIPQHISDEQAATIPLAATTAWLAFFSQDCLHIPRGNNPPSVLVWGGSSSVGQYAIQLAAIEGLKVITTCSPRNFDLVKKLGASEVFDYNDSDVVKKISSVDSNLKYYFDTIGSKSSSEMGCQAMNNQGKLCTVRPGKGNTENVPKGVEVSDVLVWTAFLGDHSFGEFHWPSSEADHALASELHDKIPSLLESGKLHPNRVKLLEGLESVPEGFDMYRQSTYSAEKIVYKL